MRLSQNIKRLRLERNLTQEQLASMLGISAQAVSKWETSDTYPDGALFVPLAEALGVSLDALFGHDAVSMADIAERIMRLFKEAEAKERFHLARDIGWQIERGLFNARMPLNERYDPDALKNQHNSSYICDDHGFTLISNGKEPFFSVFPEPEDGFGHFLEDLDDLQQIFRALSSPETMTALVYLWRLKERCFFERTVIARECAIPEEKLGDVIEDLLTLRVISEQKLVINGEERTLYYASPSHKLLALLLVAREVNYRGAYSLQGHVRKKPLLR